MSQKLVTIGNSKGFIIPKNALDQLGFGPEEKYEFDVDTSTNSLVISKEGQKKQLKPSSRFFTLLEKVNKEYGPALKKLAEL